MSAKPATAENKPKGLASLNERERRLLSGMLFVFFLLGTFLIYYIAQSGQAKTEAEIDRLKEQFSLSRGIQSKDIKRNHPAPLSRQGLILRRQFRHFNHLKQGLPAFHQAPHFAARQSPRIRIKGRHYLNRRRRRKPGPRDQKHLNHFCQFHFK